MSQNKLPVDCVIPAAGLSSRMGAWKMMLPFRGKTILDHSIDCARSVCDRVILVTGYHADELKERYSEDDGLALVHNPNFKSGMVSSIQCGIASVDSDYFFVSHGDMPLISEAIFRAVWQARMSGVVFPGSPEVSGHPVLFASELIELISASKNSQSIKPILKQIKKHYLGLDDPSIYLDIDTPQAYQDLIHSKSF